MKNHKVIRMISLKCLKNQFKILNFNQEPYKKKKVEADNEDEKQYKSFYEGECKLIDVMIEFENLDIGFHTEKTMIILIKKI